MQIKKLLVFAALPIALSGCPDKAETKPDPQAGAKDSGSVVPATGAAAPASSAKAGGGW